MYLTSSDFENLEMFDEIDDEEFDKLCKIAELNVNLYTKNYYKYRDFKSEIKFKKDIFKLAVAYQVDYLNRSGVLTSDDKVSMSSLSIGRTKIDYNNHQNSNTSGTKYNLCVDTINLLNSIGFSYSGVAYDR